MSQSINPSISPTNTLDPKHTYAASVTVSQTSFDSYSLYTTSASPYPSPYVSSTSYRTITGSSSPILLVPVGNIDDNNVTFPRNYFLYIGIPVGLLILCLIGYILDIKQKNRVLKRMNFVSPVQTVNNNSRLPLNKIPPFSSV
jgi:hypothetical protein